MKEKKRSADFTNAQKILKSSQMHKIPDPHKCTKDLEIFTNAEIFTNSQKILRSSQMHKRP